MDFPIARVRIRTAHGRPRPTAAASEPAPRLPARRAILVAVVALVALVAVGCSPKPIEIVVHNPTEESFLLRLGWSYGEVHVLRVPPGTWATVRSAQADYRPLVELLRPDCSVLGSWTLEASALIRIGSDGGPTAGSLEALPPGTELAEIGTDEVAACGNTQFTESPPAS